MSLFVLPVGTTVFRRYDEQTYTKMSESESIEKPCEWRSPKGHFISVSDFCIQTKYNLYTDIKHPNAV